MTEATLSDHLAAAADPFVPKALVASRNLELIHQLASRFPAKLSEFFGFECRLGEDSRGSDFLFCSKAEFDGPEALAGLPIDGISGHAGEMHSPWHRTQAFARKWKEPDSSLHQHVQNVWLEFDIEENPSRIPVPSIFIGTGSLAGTGTAAPAWLLEDVLTTLNGTGISAELRSSLDKVMEALPANASIFQVGLMLGRARDSEFLRVCVRGLPLEQAADYVAAVGWRGPKHELHALLAEMHGYCDSVDLDLDFVPEAGPKIGLECCLDFNPSMPAKLARLLAHLESRGLCTKEKVQGLLGWSGAINERDSTNGWPSDLRQQSMLAGDSRVSMFFRWVHHIKLSYAPGNPLEAKAYLAIRHVWMTAQLMQQIHDAAHSS